MSQSYDRQFFVILVEGLHMLSIKNKGIFFFIGIMLFSLTSCESIEEEVDEAIHVPSAYAHVGLQPFMDKVTVEMVRETNDSLRQLELRYENEDIHTNRWLDLYRDVLNIDVRYKWTADSPAYYQQLFADLSAKRLPDIVRVDAAQMRSLAKQGLIADLTEVFDTYVTPYTLDVLSDGGVNYIESAYIDGKLMGIPEIGSPVDKMQFLWIRMDWLEKLKLDPPKTMEDVLNLSHAFTHQDPNDNGKDDTLGLGVTNYLWNPIGGLHGFMAGFHAYPQIWIENEDGTVVYGGIQEEVKTALSVLRDMYLDGQIDESFIYRDSDHMREQIIQGKLGMFFGEQWASFYAEQSFIEDPQADWRAFPIMSHDQSDVFMPLSSGVEYYWVVKKDFEYPEALVKIINLHLEKNWGTTAEYEQYYSTPYSVWQFSPITPYPIYKNLEAFRQIKKAVKEDNTEHLTGEAKSIYRMLMNYEQGDLAGWGWYRTYGPDGAYDLLDQFVQDGRLLYDVYDWPSTESMNELETILTNRQIDAYHNIILGQQVADFDLFVEDWNRLGGEVLTDQINVSHQE